MQNTGTWDSDLVLLFMALFLLPIFVSVLRNLFASYTPLHSHEDVLPNVVGSDIVIEDNKTEMAAMQAELKLVKEQLSKLQTKKNKSEEGEKDKTIMKEASKALNKLGVQKSHANSVIKNLCKEKTYNSSEDLLKDAIVYIG